MGIKVLQMNVMVNLSGLSGTKSVKSYNPHAEMWADYNAALSEYHRENTFEERESAVAHTSFWRKFKNGINYQKSYSFRATYCFNSTIILIFEVYYIKESRWNHM